jgi:hypothetical protein
MNDKLEVLVTGSSRPQLWPFFWNSFNKMCIIRERPKVTVHEDFVFKKESEKVVKWVNANVQCTLDTDDPAIGLGRTLTAYITKRLEKPYIFYLQEDWEFERPIDIDQIIWTMEQHKHINQIFFNKIRNRGVINKQKQEQRDFSNLKCCVYHGFTFNPGIWRTSFVKKWWPTGVTDRPEGAFQNIFGSHTKRSDVKYCEDTIGSYIYGPHGDHRYIRHLGNDWRMARWRLENHGGKIVPGGNHNSKTMDKNYMAPWVPYPKRPIQRRDLADE